MTQDQSDLDGVNAARTRFRGLNGDTKDAVFAGTYALLLRAHKDVRSARRAAGFAVMLLILSLALNIWLALLV